MGGSSSWTGGRDLVCRGQAIRWLVAVAVAVAAVVVVLLGVLSPTYRLHLPREHV